jgi:hypothetical protein
VAGNVVIVRYACWRSLGWANTGEGGSQKMQDEVSEKGRADFCLCFWLELEEVVGWLKGPTNDVGKETDDEAMRYVEDQ